MTMIAEVIVDVANSAVDKVFEYIIPENLGVFEGARVLVPFGPRKILGYVLSIKNSPSTHHALKEVLAIKEGGSILPEMLELCAFMVEEYNIKWVDALRLCISREVRNETAKEKHILMCKLTGAEGLEEYITSLPSKSQKQKDVINSLKLASQKKVELEKNFGTSAVSTLVKKGFVEVFEETERRKPLALKTNQQKKVALNPDQAFAVENITKFLRQTYVLFGVTGSGKTEVYLNSIEKALERGKTAILLVPEIGLTPQVFALLESRFGQKVAVLHSGLSVGERFDEWKRIENGEARVVVGARSAIFAPLKNVGLILIDEQHENSYNSETNPRYRTEDIALFRAKYNNCPLVLGSATPSIETFEKTVSGEYMLLRMPNRVHEAPLPETTIVDMRNEIARGNDSIFSMPLLSAISEAIKSNKQTILFINRRGYTSFLRCMECGYIPKCTDCDAPLVYHKEGDVLKCHFCGKKYRTLTACPNCKSVHIRQGAIGTQKVVDEIKKLFPSVPVFRMDNDTTSGKNGHQKVLEAFKAESPAILVGTQMLAKGHDFDNVEVVGVLDADQTLYQTDYKSAERTFQLITQVSGRAGRKSGGGKVFLQTFNPKHFVYRFVANKNYEAFFDQEISVRETTNFPPYAVIVRLLISHEKEEVAYQKTKNIFEALKPLKEEFGENIVFLNAMASPFTRLKNKYRFQVLIRFTKQIKDDIMKKIYQTVNIHQDGKCQIFVEINPSSLA
ncbi:MAG: primosomal protein N' [Clostridia bacterium]|nr:primosomal protein N' [Clostridia bacterium]